MADLNFDEFQSEIETLTANFNNLSHALGSANTEVDIHTRAVRDNRKALILQQALMKQRIAALTTQVNNFKQLGSSVSSVAKGLASGDTGFGQLSTIMGSAITAVGGMASGLTSLIPVIGDGISKVLEKGTVVVKDIAEMSVKEFAKGFDEFKKASQTGIVNSFDELRDSAGAVSMRMEKYNAVLSSNTEGLVRIGGSTTEGRKAVDQMLAATKTTREEMMRLGVDTEEYAELQIGMMDQYRRMGRSLVDVEREHKQYFQNLSAMSQLTGVSKKELQKEVNELMLNFRFRVMIEKLRSEKKYDIANNIISAMSALKIVDPEEQKKQMAILVSNGMDANARMEDLLQTQGARTEAVEKLKAGMGADEYLNREQKIIAQALYGTVGHLTAVLDPSSPLIRNVTGRVMDHMARNVSISAADIIKEQDKVTADAASNNAKMATAATKMNDASVKMQQLATSSGVVTKAVSIMATVINETTKYVQAKVQGKNVEPPDFNKLLKDQKNLNTGFTGSAGSSAAGTGFGNEQGDLMGGGGAAPAATPATPTPTTSSAVPAEPTSTAGAGSASVLADVIAKNESGKAGYNAYNKGTVGNKIIGADKQIDFSKMTIAEYFRLASLPMNNPDRLFAVGKYQIIPSTMQEIVKTLKIDPNTTYLDPKTQDLLFMNGLIKGKRPGVAAYINGKTNNRDRAILELAMEFASVGVPYPAGNATRRGESYYSGKGGNRAHTSPEVAGAALDQERMKKAGPVGVDGGAMPVRQAKTGGIFDGPESGYPMELHGNEAVVPLPSGSKIPVSLNDSGVFSGIANKLQKIVRLMESTHAMSKEQLRYAKK